MLRLMVLIVALGVAPLWAQTKPDAQGDPITSFEEQDAVMNAAMAEAASTLPLFLLSAMTTDGQGLPTAMLKVAMPAVGGGTEVIWVDGIARTATGFTGYLANQPHYLGPLSRGDFVEFSRDMIADWAITSPTGRLYGHYTTRVIARLPGNEYLWDVLEPQPLPPGWQ